MANGIIEGNRARLNRRVQKRSGWPDNGTGKPRCRPTIPRAVIGAPPQTLGRTESDVNAAAVSGLIARVSYFRTGALLECICISQNFNDRRARAVHSDWHSLVR
jgi:hypothetical protein